MSIEAIVQQQRIYFATGKTLPVKQRISNLKALEDAILRHEPAIYEALQADLGKSETESYMCEVGMTLAELRYLIRHVKRWSKPQRVRTPLAQLHAKSFTVANPYGVVLIMSPWNYPFMLTMEPLVGALACGNCCVVKPSAYAPAIARVMKDIIAECFPPDYVAVIEGGRAENQALLQQTFDYIFFTGGITVGKEVMRHAAETLTPVSLELGGKSPVIVDATANIDRAAKRIAFGKLLNCGQTCVAPDYVLVDASVEAQLVQRLKQHLTNMAGEDPLANPDYVHMINRRHFDRVIGLINPDKVAFGGKSNPETLRIEPTILQGVTPEDAVMQEEIFGPVLPIISVSNVEEAFCFVEERPHPLACYLFTQDKAAQAYYRNHLAFGGGCINDTIIHLATSNMGFGGVGTSGMGSYHGKQSFDTFSHRKSIVKKYTWLDTPIRYAPYDKAQQRFLRLFLR